VSIIAECFLLPFEEIDDWLGAPDVEGASDDGAKCMGDMGDEVTAANGENDDGKHIVADDDVGIDDDDGEVIDEDWSIGADDEDGGAAGKEVSVFLEKIDGAPVDVAAGPICNNAMKGAMMDGGKSGFNGPESAAYIDSWSLGPPEPSSSPPFAPSWANRPLAVDLGMISSIFWRYGHGLWSIALSIPFF
jgi:hypothetical protein